MLKTLQHKARVQLENIGVKFRKQKDKKNKNMVRARYFTKITENSWKKGRSNIGIIADLLNRSCLRV